MAKTRQKREQEEKKGPQPPVEEKKKESKYEKLIFLGAVNFWVIVLVLIGAYFLGYINPRYGAAVLTVAKNNGDVLNFKEFELFSELREEKLKDEAQLSRSKGMLTSEEIDKTNKELDAEMEKIKEARFFVENRLKRKEKDLAGLNEKLKELEKKEGKFAQYQIDFRSAVQPRVGVNKFLETLKSLEPPDAARELIRNVPEKRTLENLLKEPEAILAADIFARMPAARRAEIKLLLENDYPEFSRMIDKLLMNGAIIGVGGGT